jgi:hydroxymethylglutaryl-CoA synthase
VVDDLIQGRTVKIKVVIPEGFSSWQIAERLEEGGLCGRQEFMDVIRQKEWEGYLFPATYAFDWGQAADWEFACKAGTEAVQASIGMVGSGMGAYTLSIGMDTAQGRPGDALEYTAASGGAAFIIGLADEACAVYQGSYSFVTDTPDFWRRSGETYPSHGDRFTGEPAYFNHTLTSAQTLMDMMGTTAKDYTHAVFHQPNVKFPSRAAGMLGFAPEQIEHGLLANLVGNVYSGSCMLGLTAILDVASSGDRILMVSYGSGAGSDAFDLVVTERINGKRDLAPRTRSYINRRTEIDYATYCRFRDKLKG